MPIKVQGTEVITNNRKLINLDGAGVSGIVTSLVAGTGINISGATGQVTISNTYTNSAGFTSVANSTLDLNGDGTLNYNDSFSFFSGCIPTQVSIANTTNTAGLTFTEGDILYAYTGAQQYSGSFSLFTRNSTYPYADNYINAAPTTGMSFGAKNFAFFQTMKDGNGVPQTSIELSSNGNLNFVYDDNVKIQIGAGCSITTGSGNVFIGGYSGYKTNTGLCNIAIGCYSFSENTAGSWNVSIGTLAANTVTNGIGNIFLGSFAGEFANYGVNDDYNIHIGSGAGRYSGAGGGITRRNIFIGESAGHGNNLTSGVNNIFMGSFVGYASTNGSDNVFIGNNAGRCVFYSCRNTFLGPNVAWLADGGTNNVAIGYQAATYLAVNSTSNVVIGPLAGTAMGQFGNPVCFNIGIGPSALGGTNNAGSDCNTAIGPFAGTYLEGVSSIAIGHSAGYCNSGNYAVIIGDSAGFNNDGSDNIFIGRQAGYGNTTGFNNNFIGVSAGYFNETGSNNNFFGNNAGRGVVGAGGSCNNFFGYNAGYLIETGLNNNFFGTSAGYKNRTASNNNFFGNNAGYNNTTGCNNNFIGCQAGRANTTGSYNNYIGENIAVNAPSVAALYNNIIGYWAGLCAGGACNNIIGYLAGANITGNDNTFIGTLVGVAQTTGVRNVYIGSSAGRFFSSGSRNIFLGDYAGAGCVDGISTNTGSYNIFIGNDSGRSNSSGNNNVFIGPRAGQSITSGGNNIAIGLNAGYTGLSPSGLINLTTTSNNIVIGNANITNFYTKMAATGSGGNAVCWNSSTYELYSASSSARYKENIRPFLSGVKELVDIEPVTFTYIDRPDEPEQIGFIAEQLDEIGLTHFVNYDKDNRPDSVSYDRVIVLAINAIKELNNENQELKLRITQLENVVGISSLGSN